MAITLLEASKQVKGEVFRSAVIEMFASTHDILTALPYIDIAGGSYNYLQEGELPGVSFRGLNEAITTTTGILNPQVEHLKIVSSQLDVDNALLKMTSNDVRDTHERQHIKAHALNVADKIINGDSLNDPREFDGLRVRIKGSQLIPANLGAPAANSPLSLEALDKAIDEVKNPTHLIMDVAMRRKLTQAAKTPSVAGDLRFEKDDFGRRVGFYNDLPILLSDENNLGQRIIDFNEAGPAGGTTSTSIYVVSLMQDKVVGLQNGIMEAEDRGKIDDGNVLRTYFEWITGLAVLDGRSCSRVWGITNATVTA